MLNVNVNPKIFPKFDANGYQFDFSSGSVTFRNREGLVLFEVIHDSFTHGNTIITANNRYDVGTENISISCNPKGEPSLCFKENGWNKSIRINYNGEEV